MKNGQMDERTAKYAKLVARLAPRSEMGKGLLRAFWVGGTICAIGQGISDVFTRVLMWGSESAAFAVSIVLLLISALLTGLGIYDRIGRYAGAGSIVPITGFGNSIVSSAMEFRREGLITGVGVKLFTVAGPVLVYGISASIIVGLITFFLEMI